MNSQLADWINKGIKLNSLSSILSHINAFVAKADKQCHVPGERGEIRYVL